MTQRSDLEQAAYKWGRQHRPVGWMEIDHLENPRINCTNATEGHLADMVAEFVAAEQYTSGVGK